MPGVRWILPVAAVAAVLAMGTAAAQTSEDTSNEPQFPTARFAEGTNKASVTSDGVTATLRLDRGTKPDPSKDKVWLNISIGLMPVAQVSLPDSGLTPPETEASIANIDPGNHTPEVYFSAYTGGAHCCSNVVVAEERPHGWTTVKVGEFDGDGGYLQDVDHDGLAEIVTVDNRFLYTFDCYACSAAPLRIFTVSAGAVVDVSTDPRYLPAHRDWLAQLDESVDPSTRWTSAGFLAGWVAEKVRVGEGADAWKELKAHWNYAQDAGEETCLTGADLDACPKGQTKVLKFPDHLKLFLDQNGYGT